MTDITLNRDRLDEILFDALRAVYQFEKEKVRCFSLTYEQIYVLQFLRRRSPAPMKEIADELGIPISSATRLIDRLEGMHLVVRERDETDRRVMRVTLLERGERRVRDVEEHTFSIISRNLGDFNAEEVSAFIKTAGCLRGVLAVNPARKTPPPE